MLHEPGAQPHEERLASLLRRWRAEARSLRCTLAELQAEQDQAARDSTWLQLHGEDPGSVLRRHIAQLQLECDDIAVELMHVRLAIQGAEIELAQLGSTGRDRMQPMPA